jgi:hypothetical protein
LVLFTAANALWAFEQPDAGASAPELIAFYTDLSDRIVAVGGILLGLAAGLGAESVNLAAAVRAGDGELTESLALALFDISYVFGSYATGIGFGVATLATGVAALRSRVLLPRPLAGAAVVIGLAMITPLAGYLLGEYTVAPCFVLFAILSALLLRDPG